MAGGLMVRQEPKAVIKSQSVDWHSVVTHTALSVITQNTVPRTLQGSKEHTHKYVLCFNMKIIWKILFGATLYKITITWLVFHMP